MVWPSYEEHRSRAASLPQEVRMLRGESPPLENAKVVAAQVVRMVEEAEGTSADNSDAAATNSGEEAEKLAEAAADGTKERPATAKV